MTNTMIHIFHTSIALFICQPSDSVGANPFSHPEDSKPQQATGGADTKKTEPEDENLQSRYHMKDDQREIKERFEEKQRVEARKLAQEEKKAAKKAKDAVLKQIQEDREMAKLKRAAKSPSSTSTGSAETRTSTESQAEPDAASPPKQESALLQVNVYITGVKY